MKSKIKLFEVNYSSGNSKHLLNRIIAPDAETAIRQSMSIFKDKLSRLRNIELSRRELPLKRIVLNANGEMG